MLLSLAPAVVVLAVADSASAGATLMSGLGGTVGYGPDCMPPCDDGFWPADLVGLDLTAAFPAGLHFYSGTYTHGWINNNGSLSFRHGITKYTPTAFPGAPQPMIAPYWADVDTRRVGDTWTVGFGAPGMGSCIDGNYSSGGTFPPGDVCHNPPTDGVWWSIAPGQLVVTWDHVGVFECQWSSMSTPGIEMTFQMILTSVPSCGADGGGGGSDGGDGGGADGGAGGLDFDIEFRYAECGWEAGIASGGKKGGYCAGGPDAGTTPFRCIPAQAGFDSAQIPDTNYASLPKSRMSGVSNELCDQSNVSPPQPGVWRFNVRGGSISCATAGQPCDTGMPGVCAAGQISCTIGGATTCNPLTAAGPTKCNGLDNNCDGKIDTGPCPAGTTCDGHECVASCLEGRTCPGGQTCSSAGYCVETDCLTVTCPSGEHCQGGSCVSDCAGVTCPIGQVCRSGNCVDPCKGLGCGMGQVCENGACTLACPCPACMSSLTCETEGPLAGHCVEPDCATVSCPAGEVCQGGTCVSACTGAVCPLGQMCKKGNCVTPPPSNDGGFHPPPMDASVAPDASSHDASADGGNGFGSTPKAGCGCGAMADTGGGGWLVALSVGVTFMVARRRRKNRSSSHYR